MNVGYLPLFADLDSGADLGFTGTREGDELLDGCLRASGREVGQVVGGVARFCDFEWSAEEIARIMTTPWLTLKWRDKTPGRAVGVEETFCEELAALEGVIVEIAAGPGGGNLQGILHRNPRASLIVNDSSHRLLCRWREFILEQRLAEGVCFAAFDARKPPLRDESIAAVSGVAAFGNIGSLDPFREAYRVLQPGGTLYSWDMAIDPDDWQRLPEGHRNAEEERAPGVAEGITRPLEQVGFRIERRESAPGRALTVEQDGLQVRAEPYGVTLHTVFECIKARKPA